MTPKTKNAVVWILAGLLAFTFFGSGITKLFGADLQIQNLESWGYPLWLRFPIGLSEIALAIGLLIPAYRRWVTYAIFGWAVVAVFTHLQASPPQYELLGGPIVFLVLNYALFHLTQKEEKQLELC